MVAMPPKASNPKSFILYYGTPTFQTVELLKDTKEIEVRIRRMKER
jgi:hypothetical protein